MNKKIGIIGCGWLGLPLAKKFVEKGYMVFGSTTTPQKIKILENAKIFPYLIDLNHEKYLSSLEDLIKKVDILVINIPPGLRRQSTSDYLQGNLRILETLQKTKTHKNILFVSSTSVYGNTHHKLVTEKTSPMPETPSGKILLQTEETFKKLNPISLTILRLAGLIDEQRHPIFTLASRGEVTNAHFPVNLIHKKDCIEIIVKIVESHCWNEIFNASFPFHPTKKQYYTQMAHQKNLSVPKFKSEDRKKGKIIDSSYLINKLRYTFEHPIGP